MRTEQQRVIGLDRIKLTGEKDMNSSDVATWFVERMQALGAECFEQRTKHIQVRLYSPTGSSDFLTIKQRGRYIEILGSVASFLYGGRRVLEFHELNEALGYISEALELNLQSTRVDSIEITADAFLPMQYMEYISALHPAPQMERVEQKGTLYFRRKGRARRGKSKNRPAKQLAVYDKGLEMGAAPASGCLLRVELTLTGGAYTLRRTIGAKQAVMASDLTRPVIWNSLCDQLVSSFKAVISDGQLNTNSKMKPNDRLTYALVKALNRFIDSLDAPEVRECLQEMDKSARSRYRQKIRSVTDDVCSTAGNSSGRADELREFINEAEQRSKQDGR